MSVHPRAPIGATFCPLTVRPAGPASYYASDPEALAAHLEIVRGWLRTPGRSEHELARLAYGGALVVVYYSGTALVQGARPHVAHATLAQLVEREAVQ